MNDNNSQLTLNEQQKKYLLERINMECAFLKDGQMDDCDIDYWVEISRSPILPDQLNYCEPTTYKKYKEERDHDSVN